MNAALKSKSPMALAWRDKIRAILVLNGGHFESVILSRLKKIIGGFKSGAAKEFNGGGVIKVYALESCEEILKALKEALIW